MAATVTMVAITVTLLSSQHFSRIVLLDNHWLHVATKHLNCGWSQLRCAVTVKYTPLKGETTVSLQFTSDCDVTKK